VASDWASSQALRGVTEGDATRFALTRREPILVELEAFAAYVAGAAEGGVVTLAEGRETVVAAEAALASAARGETVTVAS
jgi:predicted dehydrogenase